MISITILYPKTDDSTFDMDYYATKHMPMFAEALGDNCKGWGVTKVTRGDYEAIAWAMVESADELRTAMKERMGPVMADLSNYSNVQGQVVIGDVIV